MHNERGEGTNMFWNRKEKNLVAVTHVTSDRDQKKLTVRLAFADRKPLEVIVSPDVIQRLATMFGSLATTIHDSQSGRDEVPQPSREFSERARQLAAETEDPREREVLLRIADRWHSNEPQTATKLVIVAKAVSD
jgi:hypothetical protein